MKQFTLSERALIRASLLNRKKNNYQMTQYFLEDWPTLKVFVKENEEINSLIHKLDS